MTTFRINGKTVTRKQWDARRTRNGIQEICDSGCVPGIRTDTTFMKGSHSDPNVGEVDFLAAKAAGVAVEGKKYFGSLGAPEDPDAWQDNLGDVKRAAKRKNLNLYRHDEHVVKAREVEPKPETPYRVADDLVDKYTGYAIQDDPQIAETPQQVAELKEQVRKELTPADAG